MCPNDHVIIVQKKPRKTEQVFDLKKIQLAALEVIKGVLTCTLAHPQELSVEIVAGDKTTVFEIDIASSDFGRLLGSKGKSIDALRTLVAAMGAVHGFRFIIRVKNEERFY